MADPGAQEPLAKQRDLYEVLEIPKTATEEDIKKAYRKLALKYHPDKNRDGDPAKTEKFKEVNHANAVLSNPSKRKIYDEYGEMGLKMMDQFGEDAMKYVLNPWMKWLVIGFGLVTGGCCCCCCFCFCCCNFCCGKFKPEHPDMQSDFGDLHRPAAGEEPVTVQPGAPVVLEMPAPERAPPAQTVSQV